MHGSEEADILKMVRLGSNVDSNTEEIWQKEFVLKV